MPKPHMIELDGKMVCVKDYCRIKGISYQAITNRKQRTNKTYEEILCDYEYGLYSPTKIDLNGNLITVKEYCIQNGISYQAVYTRKELTGESFEDVIAYYEAGNGRYKFSIEGRLLSVPEYCACMGYDYKSVRRLKFKYKLSWEDAIEKYLENKAKRVAKDARFYNIWHKMMQRCYNIKDPNYKRYGKRGISVQESWHDYFNFEDDLYESYIDHCEKYGIKDTTLDRFPNKLGNYESKNTRWATYEEQANNLTTNIMITEDLTLAQFCKKYDLPYATTKARYEKGWTVEKILNTKINHKIILSTGETLAELSARTNIPYRNLYERYRKGYTVEQMINPPNKRIKVIAPTGESIQEISDRLHIPTDVLYKRHAMGWDWEKILNTAYTPPKKKL